MPAGFLDLDRLTSSATGRAALAVARPLLARALGLTELHRLYRRLPAASPGLFADLALNALQITVRCDDRERTRVPERGPLIVVANHPHGALDGLALLSLVRRVRPDIRLLANHWLAAIPELTDTCFFVDPFGGPGAVERSRCGLRQAHVWLRQGGALIVFPAGEVAHDTSDRGTSAHTTPADSPWSTTMARLARAAGAPVVPVHIAGRNSPLFYQVGRVHPALRTCLLAREFLGARRSSVHIRVGIPIPAAVHDSETALTDAAAFASRQLDTSLERERAVEEELAALPPDACLARVGDLRVFAARAPHIPHTLRDIGRLREQSFRAVGEGTGADIDLDEFDRDYVHLFAWDDRARCLVGAYRLGLVDRLVAHGGVGALYTRTLFRYDQGFVDQLGPAIELGRSFVRVEYQRHHAALLVLWRGIGQFVARHPHYRRLFGPVSISARYLDVSQQLLMTFLERQHGDRALATLVTPTAPALPRARADDVTSSSWTADEVHHLIASWEPDRKGMPVLLRHYLKLGARVVGFNVDAAFGNTLDALMVVDLPSIERPVLTRYFGSDEAARYLVYHASDRHIDHAA